jgi:hypothetical protein
MVVLSAAVSFQRVLRGKPFGALADVHGDALHCARHGAEGLGVLLRGGVMDIERLQPARNE